MPEPAEPDTSRAPPALEAGLDAPPSVQALIKQRRERIMKGKLLSDAGAIEEGTAVDIGPKVTTNNERTAADVGGESTTPAPVYAVADSDGHKEEVDTRDIAVQR